MGSHVLSIQGLAPSSEKSKTSEDNKKATVLWALKEAKDRGVDFYDASHEKDIKTRAK